MQQELEKLLHVTCHIHLGMTEYLLAQKMATSMLLRATSQRFGDGMSICTRLGTSISVVPTALMWPPVLFCLLVLKQNLKILYIPN
jgi:hypothetical protein